MHFLNLNRSKGFSILAVILVIVTITVAIGIWSLSGQSNTQSSGNSGIDIQASTIINDSVSIKATYDSLLINGILSNNIIFMPNAATQSPATNILDPLSGISTHKPNRASLRQVNPLPAPEGFWIFHRNLRIKNIGSTNSDFAIVLAGINDSVCKRINYQLYGIDSIDNINASGTTIVNGLLSMGAISASNPTSNMIFPLNPVLATGTSGCVGSSGEPNNNLYFKILQVN